MQVQDRMEPEAAEARRAAAEAERIAEDEASRRAALQMGFAAGLLFIGSAAVDSVIPK